MVWVGIALIIFATWLLSPPKLSSGQTYEPDNIEKIEVVDGDTLKIYYKNNKGWFGVKKENIRIPRIDTTELKDKRPVYQKLANLAKAFVIGWVKEAKHIKVIDTKKRDKYGRPMPEIELDGVNLSDKLLEFDFNGVKCSLAVKYGGKNKGDAWE